MRAPTRSPRRTTVEKSLDRRIRCAGGSTGERVRFAANRAVRPKARCDPCDAAPRESRARRGCACAAGNRASLRGGGCSAGRCACSRSGSIVVQICRSTATSTETVVTGQSATGLTSRRKLPRRSRTRTRLVRPVAFDRRLRQSIPICVRRAWRRGAQTTSGYGSRPPRVKPLTGQHSCQAHTTVPRPAWWRRAQPHLAPDTLTSVQASRSTSPCTCSWGPCSVPFGTRTRRLADRHAIPYCRDGNPLLGSPLVSPASDDTSSLHGTRFRPQTVDKSVGFGCRVSA